MNTQGIVLVVSVSIIRDEKVLMIKENKPTALNKWNFPSGRIERREDILHAARREVKEETGYDVKLTKTTGIYNFISSSNHQVILFHFIGEVIGGSLKIEEEQIIDSKWIKVTDLMNTDNIDLRDAGVIKQIVSKLINKDFYPMTIFHDQLSNEG
ncbi:NUDIX domain-containing protein [Neobacillus sp. PS3-34]|uniref:NUDIX hydrolase n=1 Tax=Neobacillus sp. PS3-34 TaxID=3070678 RepID=UPI0027DEB7F7|nr:NUDIX domain-containing protein [Neobacillus sp. PS3-34]WML48291.1 NUDIX domain-containing protein [Neobacillus sp. PS3-34]